MFWNFVFEFHWNGGKLIFYFYLHKRSYRDRHKLMLWCHGDSFLIAMCQLLRAMATLEEDRRKRRIWLGASKAMSLMVEFARAIHEFMVAGLPELEELVLDFDENEKLIEALMTLLGLVEKNLEDVAGECVKLWEVLVEYFPVDEDVYGARFNCKNNSVHGSIKKLKERGDRECLETQRDLVANYSELVLMDLLECSFLLILAVNGHLCDRNTWSLRTGMVLNATIEKFTCQIQKCRTEYEKDVDECEAFFERYFKDLETHASETSPMSMENRFSIEYKLYQNSESMSKVLAHISEVLGSIQTESLSMMPVTKSTEVIDETRDSNSTLFTIQQRRAESFQKLQGTLEAKVNALNKIWKLENQLLRKIVQRSLPKTCSKADLEDRNNDTQQTDNQSVIDFDENDLTGSLAASGWSYEDQDEGSEDEEDAAVTSREVLDEYFELVMGKDGGGGDGIDDKDQSLNKQEDDEDVHEARQVVLEQLKTVLKPRKEAMKTREEEAYRRAYGDKPVESEDDEEVFKAPTTVQKKKRIQEEIFWGDEEAFGSSDEDVEKDDDVIVSESSNPIISADFKSKLDCILKTGGGFPIGRLSSTSDSD